MSIEKVVTVAAIKFDGAVMSASLKESEAHGDFYFVAIKRNNPPCAERPYMTITSKFNKEAGHEGEVSFFSGHYDMELEKVHAEINQHRMAA